MLEGEELVGHWVRIKKVYGDHINHLIGNVYEITDCWTDSLPYRIFDGTGGHWFDREHFTPLAEESELGRVIYGV